MRNKLHLYSVDLRNVLHTSSVNLLGLIRLAIQRYLLFSLLFVIASSAALALINVIFAQVPRVVFIVMMCLLLALMLVLIFGLSYGPLRKRTYPSLLPNGIVVLLFAFSAIKLSASGFSIDDEIYSWNYWAVQHFQGEIADFRFTFSPYPQLFSYWIAALYKALGTTSIHSLPRFFLSIPTLLLGTTLLGIARVKTWRMAGSVSLVLLLVFGAISAPLARGLADPLMSAALVLSVMLLIAYAREPQEICTLWMAASSALIASLTKQPGLIWVCFSLPAVVAVGWLRFKWPLKALTPAITAALLALIWPMWIAPTFVDNPGVIYASMEGRSLLDQFELAVQRYLIGRPEIFLLLIVCLLCTWRIVLLRLLVLLALLPMFLAWFVFGAYDIRLGIHVLALSGLLTICAITQQTKNCTSGQNVLKPSRVECQRRPILLAISFTIAAFSAILFGVLMLATENMIDLKDGAKTTLGIQYGQNSRPIIDQILSQKARVWTTSNYSFGPFYGRLPVGFPSYFKKPYTIASIEEQSRVYTTASVKAELLAFDADYAVQSGQVAFGPASELLRSLAQQCPKSLIPTLQPPNQYGFILYSVDLEQLAKEPCQ